MPRSEHAVPTVAVRLDLVDRPDAITEIVAQIAAVGGSLRTLSTVRRWKDESGDSLIEVEIEVEGLPQDQVTGILDRLPSLRGCRLTQALDKVFGTRLIVIGAGPRSPRPCSAR